MKLSKLVLIAALAVGGVSAVQAAPDTAKIAAKLQAASVVTTAKLPPSPTQEEKKVLRTFYFNLSVVERQKLNQEFQDLTENQQRALRRWWHDVQTSPS